MTLASLALDGANLAHAFQFTLEPRDPFLDTATIDFQLRFPRAAGADAIRPGRLLQFLGDGIDDFGAGRIRQLGEFFHRIAQVPFRDTCLLETDQERALLFFLRTNFDHSPAKTRDALCEMSSAASAGSCAERFSDGKLVWRRNQVNCLLA